AAQSALERIIVLTRGSRRVRIRTRIQNSGLVARPASLLSIRGVGLGGRARVPLRGSEDRPEVRDACFAFAGGRQRRSVGWSPLGRAALVTAARDVLLGGRAQAGYRSS